MSATIDNNCRLCIRTIEYAATRRIADKKGRGRRKGSSLVKVQFNTTQKFVDHTRDKFSFSAMLLMAHKSLLLKKCLWQQE